ncbi:hypothetical protein PCG10_004257 [Penicillium crustosum]|uniref:Uncharacterized protein n=2 Tax=Penicillium crustosum TaxID=36656 RepID=A0A9P5GS26_PENCR|nr:hypothetical protein PCG10_004257 [Penicillium crustosum]
MPPVTNGKFSYNVDTFYVAASGGQIHRRAAPAEIKALYDTVTTDKSTPDHPGHWYEAQLLHYGLPPSKVKATAKMRLLKAVQDGALSVPKESLQIERNLKKEWKKQDSEENPQANTKITTTKTITTKTVTVSKTVASKTTESKTTTAKAVAKPAATKAALPKKDTAPRTIGSKATVAKPAAAKLATPKPAPKKATAPRTFTPKATAILAAATKPAAKPTAAKPTTPLTAPVKRKRASNDKETPNQPQTTKRRVSSKKGQYNTNVPTRNHPEPSGWYEQPEYQDVPPSYEVACGMVNIFSVDKRKGYVTNLLEQKGEHPYGAIDDQMDNGNASESEAYLDPPSPPRTLKHTLGLLNGTYEVRSSDIEDQWPHAMPSDGITLSLRLNGTEMWGTYEFGMFEGVLWMPERPMRPSFDRIPFMWRGWETSEGEMSFDDHQEGWIEFLGDGDIVGMISCCGDLHFRGQRIDSSVRTASDLRDEWYGYNEEEYGRESRARWGGW